MNVDHQQRSTIVARALAMGAAALKARATGATPGPRMATAPHHAQGPDTPQGSGVTAANADEVAAQLRDLAAWIGSRKTATAAHRPRAAAPLTSRTTTTGRAPRTDDEKARAISATWATLRARQQGAA